MGAMAGSQMMAAMGGGMMYSQGPMGSPQAMGMAPAGMGVPRPGGMVMLQRPIMIGPGGQQLGAQGGMLQPGMGYPAGMMPMGGGGGMMGQGVAGGIMMPGGLQPGIRPGGALPVGGPQQMMRPGMMPPGGQMQHGFIMAGPPPGAAYAPRGSYAPR